MLVGDLTPRSLEGSPFQLIIAVEFESVDAAQRFYTSP